MRASPRIITSHPSSPPRLLHLSHNVIDPTTGTASFSTLQTHSKYQQHVSTTLNSTRRIWRQNAIHIGAIHHRLHPRCHPLHLGILRLPTTRCHTRPHYRNALLQSPTRPNSILPRLPPISQMVHRNLPRAKIRHEAPPKRINGHLQRCTSIPQWMDGVCYH